MGTKQCMRAAVATVAAAAALIVPASAMAGEGYVIDGHAEFDAYAGETNHVTVRQSVGTVTFSDIVKVDIENGCQRGGSNLSVECPNAFGRPEVYLGDQSDTVEVPAGVTLPAGLLADGNAGVDLLIGSSRRDVLRGGWGADTLRGNADDDTLEGNDGDDNLHGDAGRDLLQGGWGDADVLDGDDNGPGDTLDCGPGNNDLAIYNTGDTVRSNCERTRHEL
jgi:Ca2+-binding RTX toxin-like protein